MDHPAAAAIQSPEQIVVNVQLNGVAKGDFLAYITADQDFLFRQNNFEAMGVPKAAGSTVVITGERYVSLRSIEGARFTFNPKTLTLDIELPPGLLPAQSLNLGAKLPDVRVQARAPGGFFNYRFGYSKTIGGTDAYNAATELGLNLGEFLLLDTRSFTNFAGQTQGIRLQTQLIYDQPETLRRWVIGDTFVLSGELGSAFDLGGLGVSKLYQINPYFIKQPLAGISGAVALPSTAEIYMDGARLGTQKLAPGPFSLQNLNYYQYPGLRNVEVVIKDPFGREQVIAFPYFFTDQLLAKGLHEYSYNVGFVRNHFGVSSNDYGPIALSAFHRYGWTDALTIGYSADASTTHINAGPRLLINTGRAGVISGTMSASHDRDPGRSGTAASLNHTFAAGVFSSQLFARRFSENYSVIGFNPSDKPKLQGSAAVAYGGRALGTFSLSYTKQTVYGGAPDQKATTLGYTRTVFNNTSVVINVSRITQNTSGYAAFIGLSYYSPSGHIASINHQKTKDGDNAEQFQFSKVVPIGEGIGYRILAQHSAVGGSATDIVSPFVQYNARSAIFTAEGTSIVNSGANSDFYQVSIAGAAAYIGEHLYFTRPINDSFGVARIDPPLAGVRVLKSSAEIGVTDATGTVFVPNLGSYQVNEVAIQPKDVPIDYSMPRSVQNLRPPFRAGAIARFEVRRVRAITGRLKLRTDGEVKPLEGYDFVLTGAAATARVATVQGGEFYLEDIAPGRYTAELKVSGKECRVALTVHDSQEIVVEMGDLFCELIR